MRKNAPSGVIANNFMGGIHPRLKRPVGRRLAYAAVQLIPQYRSVAKTSGTAKTGPTLAGCSLDQEAALTLHFNATLLGREALTLRPFDADMSNWMWRYDSSHHRLNKTDSQGLMVCSASAAAKVPGNATTCQCYTWAMLVLGKQSVLYCQHGPGWKPPAALLHNNATKHVKVQSNPFSTQWTAVPLRPRE